MVMKRIYGTTYLLGARGKKQNLKGMRGTNKKELG
jgi:hypothetical protein